MSLELCAAGVTFGGGLFGGRRKEALQPLDLRLALAAPQILAVVERGEAVQVIRRPAHPYTRELVAALPPPDPTIDWGLETTP